MYEQTGRYYALFGPQASVTAAEERFFAHWTRGRTAVLDFGCGLCGPAMMLSRLGCDVLGFEPSEQLAALALDRLGRATPAEQRVTLVNDTAERFAEPFEAKLILMRSVWMLLDDSQREIALRAVRRHAAPDALLIIDARTAALSWADQNSVQEQRAIGHAMFVRHTNYERAPNGDTLVHWTVRVERFGRAVETARESFRVRADTIESLRENLRRAGFDIERTYAGYDLDEPFEAGDAMIVAVARNMGNVPIS